MKTKFLLLSGFIALSAMVFTSCDDDNDDKYLYADFESANVGENGYINNEAFEENNIVFNNNYNSDFDSWSGFSVSSKTDKETEGYANQYSVYADAGANHSQQFAVGYCSTFDEKYPTITFKDGQNYTPMYAYFQLTTHTYLSIMNGDAFADKFSLADKDKLVVTVTGYDSKGETGKIDVVLADYTGTEAKLLDKWEKFDLSSLGAVSELVFTMTTTDNGDWGPNTPLYFAIDNLCFKY